MNTIVILATLLSVEELEDERVTLLTLEERRGRATRTWKAVLRGRVRGNYAKNPPEPGTCLLVSGTIAANGRVAVHQVCDLVAVVERAGAANGSAEP